MFDLFKLFTMKYAQNYIVLNIIKFLDIIF